MSRLVCLKALVFGVILGTLLTPAFVPAMGLANSPFIQQSIDRRNFEPGGAYHLFGNRGTVGNRTGSIGVVATPAQHLGGFIIEDALIEGSIGYITRFSGHGHQVHSPFSNHASRSSSDEQGNVLEGFQVYSLSWSGYELHPADGYDGPQGGGYPAPTGARDEYTYSVSGTARSVRLQPSNDTRAATERITDRFSNLVPNFSERARLAHDKIMGSEERDLNWLGRSSEIVNGLFSTAANPFISAGELLGLADTAQAAALGAQHATLGTLSVLSPDGKLSAIGALGGLSEFQSTAHAWLASHPNTAEGLEAGFNLATLGVAGARTGVATSLKSAANKDNITKTACALAFAATCAQGKLHELDDINAHRRQVEHASQQADLTQQDFAPLSLK